MSIYARCGFQALKILLLAAVMGFTGSFAENAQESSVPARLQVEVRDSRTGRIVSARIYLQDEVGRTHVPPGAVSYQRGKEHHFITRGRFEIQLPPGRYNLHAERGPEYRQARGSIALGPTESKNLLLRIERWIDMNRKGWYSGDLHNHRKVEEMPDLLLAEDLNLAPTLSDWIWEDRARSSPPIDPTPIHQVDSRHVFSTIDKEVERLRAGPGAVDLLGLKKAISFDGYQLWPPSSVYCDQAHAQGGFVDAEKITWRDMAALVALGYVDFAGIVHNHFNRHDVELETDRWGMIPKSNREFETVAGMPLWSMEVYYRFLNCGFRLPVSAGSASGVKASPLGYNRVYVRPGRAFDYRSWFASLKAGRSFGTNGPMLFFTVDRKEPGAVIQKGSIRPAPVRIRAEAISERPLDRLEIISNGKAIQTIRAPGATQRLVADFDFAVEQSGWLAARCFEPAGSTIRFAHTSPVYLVGSAPNAQTGEAAKFFIEWIDRETAHFRHLDGFKDPVHREDVLSLFSRARSVYSSLR